MICPLLPTSGVSIVLYRGDFVRQLQSALKEAARLAGQPAWDPGEIDGLYGPRTAAALLALQRSLPTDQDYTVLRELTGREYATCYVLRRLNLACERVQPVIGVTGSAAQVAQIEQAILQGRLNLSCPVQPAPPAPGPEPVRRLQPWHYLLLAVGAVVVGAAIYVGVSQLSAGGEM